MPSTQCPSVMCSLKCKNFFVNLQHRTSYISRDMGRVVLVTGVLLIRNTSFWEIQKLWDAAKTRNPGQKSLLLIADCCYSGSWVDQLKRANVSDIHMSASCGRNETCQDTFEGGVFTTRFVNAAHYLIDCPVALYFGSFNCDNQLPFNSSIQLYIHHSKLLLSNPFMSRLPFIPNTSRSCPPPFNPCCTESAEYNKSAFAGIALPKGWVHLGVNKVAQNEKFGALSLMLDQYNARKIRFFLNNRSSMVLNQPPARSFHTASPITLYQYSRTQRNATRSSMAHVYGFNGTARRRQPTPRPSNYEAALSQWQQSVNSCPCSFLLQVPAMAVLCEISLLPKISHHVNLDEVMRCLNEQAQITFRTGQQWRHSLPSGIMQ